MILLLFEKFGGFGLRSVNLKRKLWHPGFFQKTNAGIILTPYFFSRFTDLGFGIRPKFTAIFGFRIAFNPKPKPGFGHRLASFVQFPGFSQASPNFKSAYFAL